MSSAAERARHFLEHEQAFRLGALPTEQPHPVTARLSQTIAEEPAAGVRLLMQVDEDIPPTLDRVLAGPEFARLVQALAEAVWAGRRVFWTGCGATGRLAILLEAAWRTFWQEMKEKQPVWYARVPEAARWQEAFYSLMAGGDYALIRSVEGFEDWPALGRRQLAQAGMQPGDLVVAITEGGETPFVIGAAWQGLEAGATVFFVYNNPTDVLRQHVERSRQIIDEPRITKLDLFTGPMAIAGSTRMQATTTEMVVLAAGVELALADLLGPFLPPEAMAELGLAGLSAADYPARFRRLLTELRRPENVEALAQAILWEEAIYRRQGLVTYLADRFLLDVLTDTTERSPTFCLPPFRKYDQTRSPRSWAFVKNPRFSTPETWGRVFRRPLRGLDWSASVYQELGVSLPFRSGPPKLDSAEILKFQIGNEPDPSRWEAEETGLMLILVGEEILGAGAERKLLDQYLTQWGPHFTKTAALSIGPSRPDRPVQAVFPILGSLPGSPLRLWERVALKLSLNILSTGTMARLGRVEGNWMSHVEPTNKKLIDRGTRLVCVLAGVDYPTACYALHEAMDAAGKQQRSQNAPSPVAVAVGMLRSGWRPEIS